MTEENSFSEAFSAGRAGILNRWLSFKEPRGGEAEVEQKPKGSLTVDVTAVGVSLNFLDMASSGQDGGATAPASPSDEPTVAERNPSTASDPPEWLGQLTTYMLTVTLDLAMSYSLDVSGDQQIDADLHDITVEAYLGSSAAASDAYDSGMVTVRPTSVAGAGGASTNKVLQPCDVTLRFLRAGDAVELKLDTSDMALTVGIDLGPLSKPPADRPLGTAVSYTKVWPPDSPGDASMPPFGCPRAVDLFAAERGMTVWRPKVPSGYGSLGDVMTRGAELPRHHAVCLARDSGLTAPPEHYQLVLEEAGLFVWLPIAPEGFAALGCVATTVLEEPPIGTVFCVRAELLVEASPRECMCMRTRPSAGSKADGELEHLRLWNVANSASTFMAVVEGDDLGAVPCGVMLDLRAPLGIAPAALRAHMSEVARLTGMQQSAPLVSRHQCPTAAEPPAGATGGEGAAGSAEAPHEVLSWDVAMQRELAFNFVRNERRLRQERTHEQSHLEVAEFQRLWVHKDSGSRVSFWRPILPPGYVSLGDCISFGLHPPCVATVFLDGSGGGGVASAEGDPAFREPVAFEKIWEGVGVRKGHRERSHVSVWKPIAPYGYTACGCVAWLGKGSPRAKDLAVRCLRSDLVETGAEEPEHVVAWEGRARSGAKRRGPPIRVWGSNRHTGTFWGEAAPAKSSGGTFTWASRIMSDEYSNSQHASRVESPNYKVSVDTGLLSLVLLDMSRQPLLELNLGGAEAFEGSGTSGQKRHGRHTKRIGCTAHLLESAPGLLQAYFQLSMELWSLNKDHWEPVLEPFGVLVHFHHNTRSKMVASYRPGTHLEFKSTTDGLHLTVAHSAVESLFRAVADCQAVMRGEGGEVLQMARQSTRYAYVSNELGVPLHARIDFSSHAARTTLEPGQQQRWVLEHSAQFRRKRPEPMSIPKGLLLVNVSGLRLAGEGAPPGPVSASLRLLRPHELDQYMPARTRWLRSRDGAYRWDEQHILSVPDADVVAVSRALQGSLRSARSRDARGDAARRLRRQRPRRRHRCRDSRDPCHVARRAGRRRAGAAPAGEREARPDREPRERPRRGRSGWSGSPTPAVPMPRSSQRTPTASPPSSSASRRRSPGARSRASTPCAEAGARTPRWCMRTTASSPSRSS
uniref:A96521 protein n=1 Tax=Tetraselmis sp. GSL018 TaxID=582737 RepID=A0A061S6X7_9CHLO